MKKFSSAFLEQVREANDIVSVISEYVSLKKQGQNFWACCPFHHEKTASFSVSAEKGFFYCFGCHAAGDVFSFVMKQENLSFVEAVERLAERVHMPLPQVEETPTEKARDELKKQLLEINEMASNFFHNCLMKTSLGKEGLVYFHHREVTDDTIRAFKLGYAPDGWTTLTDAFQKRGIAGSLLVQLGLAKEKNGRYYDAFRRRVIFPIRDGRGRIVGFGGRVLDDSKPKYLNSPETPIFNKRKLLFAMDLSHEAIYKKKQAILVEGYMDVISLHNRGITNVVASLGTAFTVEQARLLQRQASDLVLAYDMDAAGRKATLRALEIGRGLHLHIRVLSLPQGKDPDEYIKHFGPEALQKAVQEAPHALDYLLQTAVGTHDSTTFEGKSAITAMLLPVLALVDNRIVLESFLSKMARTLHVDETAVRSEFNRYLKQHPETAQVPVVITPKLAYQLTDKRGTEPMAVAEENILRFLLEHPSECQRIITQIEDGLFQQPVRRHIYQIIISAYNENHAYTASDIQMRLTPEEAEELARIMILQDVPLDEQVVLDYAKRFRLTALQNQYLEWSKRAAEYSRTGNQKVIEALKECQRLNEEIKKVSCREERS